MQTMMGSSATAGPSRQGPSHSFPEFLPLGRNSVAQWSNKSDESLLVFVHGFGGDAIATWNEMQTMLPTDPRFAGTDLVYYGYESTRSRATVHANQFLKFVEDVLARGRPYRRIVIAAHSLGAVVARRAIIVAYTERRSWVEMCRLVLFGPAHRGASIQQLVAQGASAGLLATLYAVALYQLPVLQDLDPKSLFLKELRDEYLAHMPDPAEPPLLARSIIGESDGVVDQLDFVPPEHVESWPGNHFSVCKPNAKFLEPIDAVAKALS